MSTQTLRPPADTEYRKFYEKGWRYSQSENATLDHVDSHYRHFGNAALDAVIDGYLDLAVGREKWHLAYCQNHHNNEGGCGKV